MTPDHRPACGFCNSAIEYVVAATVVESHNDIARKRVDDEPALRAQIKADQRQAFALNNSQERGAQTEREEQAERERALAVKHSDAPPWSDLCNVCDKGDETWGPRVRACACDSTSHASCLNPFASFLRPTCQQCNGPYDHAQVSSALVGMRMNALEDKDTTARLDQEDSDRAVAQALYDSPPSPRSADLSQSSPHSSLDSQEFSVVQGRRQDAHSPAVREFLCQAPREYEEPSYFCRLYIPALDKTGGPANPGYVPWEQTMYETPAPAKRVPQSRECHEMRALTAKSKQVLSVARCFARNVFR